jgi:hypothetical protein
MRRLFSAVLALSVFASIPSSSFAFSFSPIPVVPSPQTETVVVQGMSTTFNEPIDGLSVVIPRGVSVLRVRGFDGSAWTAWQELHLENEQDPRLTESNLVMFERDVIRIELSSASLITVHPIRVSDAPAAYAVAATTSTGKPRILSRAEWGADESLRIRTGSASSSSDDDTSDTPAEGATGSTQREKDCIEAIKNYAGDFEKTDRRITELNGKPLAWPLEYSPKVKLLAVHHTAVKAAGEVRSGEERMRALYQYHAKNRGWGDIGYNFVIDDDGQIYEGRAGGDFVVGGHAYCNNTGTIGISLMGNFDIEEPTQEQMRALQWLLESLADKYKINKEKSVKYHGKTLEPIVGHRQLVSTDCPGYYVFETLDQVRRNVASGKIDTAIRFPAGGAIVKKPTKLIPNIAISTKGTFFYQDADLTGRPGGEVAFMLRFQAGSKPLAQRTSIATIARSDERLNVWVVDKNQSMRLRNNLLLPQFLRKGESVMINVRVQLPPDLGTYRLQIGDLDYVMKAEGRRIRAVTAVAARRVQRAISAPLPSRPYLNTVPVVAAEKPSLETPEAINEERKIRIRLLSDTLGLTDTVIHTSASVQVNGANNVSGNIFLEKVGDTCAASSDTGPLGSGVIRIDPKEGILTLNDWKKSLNQFRGIIECRVVDGELTLINELPIDLYLFGLGEEPDTEPYEKQRAFAIAARTYAAWYMNPKYRKFPGKPYDGSDSPAQFQKYSGYLFEQKNPRWIQAVKTTLNQVLTKDGQVIKPPYFSSSNGRTLSPSEAGWGNFPFADIFASKPDPWCEGMDQRGHGVGMSGCGSEAQANEGKKAEEILQYYYPGTKIKVGF